MSIKFSLKLSLVIYLVVSIISPSFILAATAGDTFTVGIFLGTDIEPPSIPGNFSVTAVATDQIDLDWDPATDNAGVSGYQVFRDSTQIATTTLTAYSDTGLTASTLYSYYVTAFDNSLNISTSTATLSTTTLSVATTTSTTTPSTTSSSSSSGSVSVGSYPTEIKISNFQAVTDLTSANIFFDTNIYTKATIRWGRTNNYESGYIATETFRKHYNTYVDGLESGVIYQLEIILIDNYGQNTFRYQSEIKTQPAPDLVASQNVSNLQVFLDDQKPSLSWQNPEISDFSKIRVMGSDYFYPTHEADGWLVYGGTGEGVTDNRILPNQRTRFYTVFVYDHSGNVSSGAVVSIKNNNYYDGVVLVPEESPTSSVADNNKVNLEFSYLKFTQPDFASAKFGREVKIDADQETKISLDYDLLPENLKTIVVNFSDPDDPQKVFSFLLRVNKDKSAFEAIIGPLVKSGTYSVSLEIYDFKTRQISKTSGEVIVSKNYSTKKNADSDSKFVFLKFDKNLIFAGSLFILIIIFMLFLLPLLLRKRKNEDKSL